MDLDNWKRTMLLRHASIFDENLDSKLQVRNGKLHLWKGTPNFVNLCIHCVLLSAAAGLQPLDCSEADHSASTDAAHGCNGSKHQQHDY